MALVLYWLCIGIKWTRFRSDHYSRKVCPPATTFVQLPISLLPALAPFDSCFRCMAPYGWPNVIGTTGIISTRFKAPSLRAGPSFECPYWNKLPTEPQATSFHLSCFRLLPRMAELTQNLLSMSHISCDGAHAEPTPYSSLIRCQITSRGSNTPFADLDSASLHFFPVLLHTSVLFSKDHCQFPRTVNLELIESLLDLTHDRFTQPSSSFTFNSGHSSSRLKYGFYIRRSAIFHDRTRSVFQDQIRSYTLLFLRVSTGTTCHCR